MRSSLQDIEDHLFFVMEAIESPWVREFLDASPDGPIAEQRIRELGDLSYRIGQTRNCSALATKSGATKPGPGKARPEAISPQTLCAIMVWEAWKHVHGVGPSPKNQRLAEAAEAYWRIAGGEAHNYGEEPLAFWRHHFKKAASSMARNFRAEWRRHLVESERDWKRRNSAHAEP